MYGSPEEPAPSAVRNELEEEGQMSAEYAGTVPKLGNRVGMAEQPGVFEVVDVNTLMQTANLKATDGQGHVTRNVPWTSLKFQGVAAQ
jgi:hypothetical protein